MRAPSSSSSLATQPKFFNTLAAQNLILSITLPHGADTHGDVTIPIKEFRAMLSLCESLKANVKLRFTTHGQPFVAEPDYRGVNIEASHSAFLLFH
jgi:hypothetical protein